MLRLTFPDLKKKYKTKNPRFLSLTSVEDVLVPITTSKNVIFPIDYPSQII